MIRLKFGLTFLLLTGVITITSGQPLASGQWSKFSVTADGVYKIDYQLLKKSGFNPDQIDPRKLRLFTNGNGMLPQSNAAPRQNQLVEMAIVVQGEADGKFDNGDYILFFGSGPDENHFDIAKNCFAYTHNIYSDKNFYFITVADTPGKRMAIAENKTGSYPLIDHYNDFGYYEADKYNVLTSGRTWYGDQFGAGTSLSYQFALNNVVADSPITFTSHVMGQSYDNPGTFTVFFNNLQVIKQDIDPIIDAQYAAKGTDRADTVVFSSAQVSASLQSQQTVKYQFTPAASSFSVGYLDFYIFSLIRKLVFQNEQLTFTSSDSYNNPISTFSVSGVPQTATIWDVTNPFYSKNQTFQFLADHVIFSAATDTLRKYVAFTNSQLFIPEFEQAVANQNLSQLTAPDLLIITHPDFKSEAQRLAAFRQTQNHLTTQVVTVQEIYNEYSGGKQDVTAIRDFIRDVRARGGSGLDNVLLFGRCSYDYKNRVLANTNFVPTYESRNSLDPVNTYSSDDYFGFLEANEGDWPEDPAQNYSMDIGVGRISVVTLQQARTVVSKLIDYETASDRFGTWRKNIVFVADDGDLNIHQSQADAHATRIDTGHGEFTTKKIYLDQFRQIMKPSGQYSPDAKDALTRALDAGSFIVNFTGHGSENVWTQEQILDRNLVLSLANGPRYPLYITATCEFGRHDDPFQLSSGELLLLQPNGGAIGLVTTARPVNSATNFELNESFYTALFTKSAGSFRDLGTIFRDTKNNSLSGVANRNFSLIGDPSMRLAFANDGIVLTKLATISNSDTLKGLSTVVVEGEIQQGGSKDIAFNGNALLTLFDRPSPFVTRGDENSPFNYTQWSNALFRGTVPVHSGAFAATFVLPQNIEATVGTGKVSTYAWSSNADASGVTKSFIGGVENPLPEQTGGSPFMKLYIGDTTFIPGGIASPSTVLLARLHAPNGMNISELAAAKTITALMDDSLSYDLNPYYIAISGDTIGTISFPLLDLPSGRHRIVVTGFDTFGNGVTGTISFVVTDENLQISSFYNYPNPFTSSIATTFVFTHNRPGEDLDVGLSVFDLAGQVVLSQEFSVPQSLTEVTLAEWDGTTFAGNKIGRGVYLAKVSVRSLLDGSKNQQFARLIIVN